VLTVAKHSQIDLRKHRKMFCGFKKSMMDFLEANVCITRAEYSRLVHVTARRASRDLQTFIDSGVIRKRGAGRSVVYVKG
jgi:predicted HTH transcriptional regulator